jgi:hypothetical protein
MKSLTTLLFVICMAFFGMARPANAQTHDLEVQVTVLGHTGPVAGSATDHFVTFSGPVEVPGIGLAPGAYIFRFLTPSVVQVTNQNRSMVYGMFLVTPTWRPEVTSDYAVTLRRAQIDAPARVAALFPPNASIGYELTYPKAEIAAEVDRIAIK